MSAPLVDADARQRITRSHDETLFVEAGAGSGKTSALVARLVALVLSGVPVRSIAAITFTEAAAAELRARVRQTLERIETGDVVTGVNDHPDVDSTAGAAFAARALDELDGATICTLHAFAQRLLLASPVEARLPPRLEVHDDVSSALRFEDRWRRFERTLLDDDRLDVVLRAALALGIETAKLRGVAATLGQNWDLVEEADRAGLLEAGRAVDVDLDLPVDDWIRRWGELVERRVECVDDRSPLLAWLKDEARPLLRALEANRDEPYTVLALTDPGLPSPNVGRKNEWQEGAKAEVVTCAKALLQEMKDVRHGVTDQVLTRLGAEVGRYTLDDAEARRREGRLEFHDLLVLARGVLRRSAAVRRRFHDRYTHLLIDEFQDTDPLQIEIAVRLAADPAHDPDAPWDVVEVDDGRLFFVGDPKQSIYRFRRADIELFVTTAERHAAGRSDLVVNFRSTEPVLDFCNAVFRSLIGTGPARRDPSGRVTQPPYTDLAPHRAALAGDPGPPVLVLGADGHATAAEAKEAEAADVAAALARAHDEGWLVEPKGAPPRPCRWSDMAVLLPSRTTLPHLRVALDGHQIPYRIESGTLVYETTEVTELLSVLRAIDDPGDAIAVTGALRSAVYGCGDDDLARWVADGRRLSYLGPDLDEVAAGSPVGAALVDLRARHREAPFQTVPEVVESVVRERRLMELALLDHGHRDVWRLHRVVLEHARQFADTERGGLRHFLRWIELQRDDRVRATSPVIPEADVDAVRILTIHGSKGLEFAITAVSGLCGQDPQGSTGPTVLFDRHAGYVVRIRKGMEATRFEAARTLEETMDQDERIRLLYVGLTRARDHLIVSSHHKAKTSGRANSHGLRLARCLDELGDEVACERWTAIAATDEPEADQPPADPVLDTQPPPAARDVEAWSRDMDLWRTRRAALLRPPAGVISATALSTMVEDATHVGSGEVEPGDVGSVGGERAEPAREPWRRGRAGTAIGSAVHAVLQHADLTSGDEAEIVALATWQAMVEGVPGAAGQIARKALAAARSPLVRRAVQARRWRREVHVGAQIRSGEGRSDRDLQVEGFIDLLFETDDGLVIVDYKTDAVRNEAALRAALERHTPQGAAYALALEAATERPVAEVHFLFLRDDPEVGAVAVDAVVEDLPAAVAAVADRLRVLSTEGAPR